MMKKLKITIIILLVLLASFMLSIILIVFHLNSNLKEFYDTQPYISCDLNDDRLRNYDKRDVAIIYNYYFNSERLNKIKDHSKRNLIRNLNRAAISFVSETNKKKYFKTLPCDYRKDVINAP